MLLLSPRVRRRLCSTETLVRCATPSHHVPVVVNVVGFHLEEAIDHRPVASNLRLRDPLHERAEIIPRFDRVMQLRSLHRHWMREAGHHHDIAVTEPRVAPGQVSIQAIQHTERKEAHAVEDEPRYAEPASGVSCPRQEHVGDDAVRPVFSESSFERFAEMLQGSEELERHCRGGEEGRALRRASGRWWERKQEEVNMLAEVASLLDAVIEQGRFRSGRKQSGLDAATDEEPGDVHHGDDVACGHEREEEDVESWSHQHNWYEERRKKRLQVSTLVMQHGIDNIIPTHHINGLLLLCCHNHHCHLLPSSYSPF